MRRRRTIRGISVAVMGTVALMLGGGVASASSSEWVESAQWAANTDIGGQTLKIVPTEKAKTEGRFHPQAVLRDAVEEAGSPPYSSSVYSSLYNQLRCHTDYVSVRARNKESWNLDTARQDTGYWSTVAAQCNPPVIQSGANGAW